MASLLKPIDDTRMFEKLGISFMETGEYEVTIVGYPSKADPVYQGIQFRSLSRFTRFSFTRLMAQWKIFKHINQVKPEIIIINTPELLVMAVILKILFRRKIVYDVLENYYRNIRYTPTFPILIRPILSASIRLLEWITKPFISLYILAEKGYESELPFARPFVVAENKLPEVLVNRLARSSVQTRGHHRLLFTGTLAPTTGILEAIRICKGLHAIDKAYSLTIVGYCAIPEFWKKIEAEIAGSDFVHLIGGKVLVPHSEILSEITKADVGIIIYEVNSSTESSIPTKLYEYVSLRLPILIRHNLPSHDLVSRLNGGIILPQTIDFSVLNDQLKSIAMPQIDSSLYWDHDGQKILDALKII